MQEKDDKQSVFPKQNTEILQSRGHDSTRLKIFKDKCDYLYKIGKPFTLVKSGGTYELQSNFFNEKAFRQGFTTKDLNFIKSVKKYINDKGVAVDFIDVDYKAANIKYIDVGDFDAGECIENLNYIDINHAYWRTAYNLGIISEYIYERGKEVGKVTRLAALGSLAKNKEVWVFNGEFLKKKPTQHSYDTENLWFAICKRVSDVMQEISKAIGDDFVFYWVDGIYVKNNDATTMEVLKIARKYNYSVTSMPVKSVTFKDNSFEAQGLNPTDKKEFSYCLKKDRMTIEKYIEDQRLLKIANEILYPTKKTKKSV